MAKKMQSVIGQLVMLMAGVMFYSLHVPTLLSHKGLGSCTDMSLALNVFGCVSCDV